MGSSNPIQVYGNFVKAFNWLERWHTGKCHKWMNGTDTIMFFIRGNKSTLFCKMNKRLTLNTVHPFRFIVFKIPGFYLFVYLEPFSCCLIIFGLPEIDQKYFSQICRKTANKFFHQWKKYFYAYFFLFPNKEDWLYIHKVQF